MAAVLGCSSNPSDVLGNATISTVNKAAEDLRIVKTKVNEAVDKSTKDNKELTDNDLKPAVNAAAKLKDVGREMQQIKERTDALKDSISKAEREELDQRFKGRLQDALVALDKAVTEVDQAVRRAEEKAPNKQVVDELKKTLKIAKGEFEVLAKQ
jgi:hypothetical protein